MSAAHMQPYPVLTCAAGPTNSLRGAAWLTGASEAIVIDIGGTTSDLGVLIDGFPRQSTVHVDVGGVRPNFRLPDLLSIGLVREIGSASCWLSFCFSFYFSVVPFSFYLFFFFFF